MAYDPRKKSNKIFGQIRRVAQKGKDYTLEYHKLIDDIVAKGDFAHLEMCLSDNYNLDSSKYRTIHEIKTKTWKHILFETEASFLTGLKKLYNANGVYQQGHEIRSERDGNTALRVTGNFFGHYSFKEEKVTISDKWNNKVVRSKYTQTTGTASQVWIHKEEDLNKNQYIAIALFDEKAYQIDISKVIWATYSVTPSYSIESPYELKRLKTMLPSGTQSYLTPYTATASNIPITHGGDYLVTVHRRGTPGWLSPELTSESYSYKVYVRKENLLGTIKEIDDYGPNSNYLHLNSNFARATGLKRTYLEVLREGDIEPITVIYDNLSMSEEKNLLQRYKIAIGYLNS